MHRKHLLTTLKVNSFRHQIVNEMASAAGLPCHIDPALCAALRPQKPSESLCSDELGLSGFLFFFCFFQRLHFFKMYIFNFYFNILVYYSIVYFSIFYVNIFLFKFFNLYIISRHTYLTSSFQISIFF